MPSSVIGLDLGGFGARVAKVESGGLVVLANEMSVLETPTVVSFPTSQKGVRSAGASSQPHLITQPQSSVGQIRDLLGSKILKKESLQLQQDSADKLTPEGGVSLRIEGQNHILQAEQIVASFLTHLRKNVVESETANSRNNGEEDHYVLSVPHYFTDGERAALLDAANIAKIKVMAVVNDLTASALAYGYFQRDLPPPLPAGIPTPAPNEPVPKQQLLTQRPRHVVFVDFGYGGLRAAVVEFTSAGFKMLGRAGDRKVGGGHFDERLAKHFIDKFNGQHCKQIGARKLTALTINNDRKAYAKILTAAEKTKRLLSANKESVPVSLECLHNDFDLTTKICRQEFEELCGDLFERVRGCLSELIMSVPDLDLTDLHSVEVIGGSSRIPKFKSVIEEIFGKTPRTTLHATESSAKGCALMCAAMTRIYSVKPFQVVDIATPLNIQLKYTHPLESSNSKAKNNAEVEPQEEVIAQTVFSSKETKFNEVVLLKGRPQSDTLALVYDDANCNILKQNLIAIYQLQFGDNVVVGQGDDLMVQIYVDNNGMPRFHKCKWIKRDINGGETEEDIRFKETRVGGLSQTDLVQFIQTEENMQRSDNEEEKRQEIKNSLEETTFQFRDELSSGENGIKEQAAWRDCMSLVTDLQNHIDNDENYENWTADVYENKLKCVHDKFGAYQKWKEDYRKYRESKKVRQIKETDNDSSFVGNKGQKSSSRLRVDTENNQTSPFYAPIYSNFMPLHTRYKLSDNLGGIWNSRYGRQPSFYY